MAESARVVSPWNPANAVTASRFLTLPPLYWAVSHGYHQWATLVVLICAVLDKADGFVAKIFHCKSAFGELFDAIADGLCYGFALILFAYFGWAPVIPVVAVIALGVINSIMRGRYVARVGHVANYKSYAMERAVAYIAYLTGFTTAAVEVRYFAWGIVPVMAIILAHDTKRMLIDPIDVRTGAAA